MTKVKQYFQLSKVNINNLYINFCFTKNAKISKLFAKKTICRTMLKNFLGE